MNRVALVVVMAALYLCGVVGDVDARIINLRESLGLAVGDTISAQTVMDSIKAATEVDVLVCDSLVVGEGIDLRSSGIDTVWCNLYFSGSTFQGQANFTGATFKGDVGFWGATFQGQANFTGATFRGNVKFWGTTFQEAADFGKVIFERGTTFNFAMFQNNASFPSTTFKGKVRFMKATFKLGADFRDTMFQSEIWFGFTMFHHVVHFQRAKFQGHISVFQKMTFRGGADFNEATFQNDASFGETTFEGSADFGKVMFKGGADFNEATFQKNASFGETTFGGLVSFRRATFQRDISLAEATFQGEVNLGMVLAPRAIPIIWSQLDGHTYYDRPNYFFLLRNFQQLGYTDDYDGCYYDFRVQVRKHDRRWYSPLRWLGWIFLDLTCGYGVKPFRAIVWAGSLMLLFSLIYTKKGAIELRVERQKCNGVTQDGRPCQRDRMRGTEFCPQHQDQATWRRRFKNAFYFSVGTFTTVGYGDWHPVGKHRYLAMVEGLVGWLVMALFLVTLGKTWIR